MRVSKLKTWCLEGEEGKAARGEGRKALFEVSKADVFSNCGLAGTCCSRDSPCSSAPGCAGGASLCPLRSKGSPGGDTLSPSAPCLACYLGRQLDPSRTVPGGLLQLVLPARTDSAPGAFWSRQRGSPASSDGVGHPQPHSSPARAAPVLANGPLGLLAAGLVLGLHRDRDTDLQLSGGCWGVKEQSMATLAVLMTWFEMRILHLSGFPLYF